MNESITLKDIHLYGLEEPGYCSLCAETNATAVGNSRSSVILRTACFYPCATNKDMSISGRYQWVVPGRLYNTEGEELWGDYVLKIPKNEPREAENAKMLARLEAGKVDFLQAFQTIVSPPLGYATAQFPQDSELTLQYNEPSSKNLTTIPCTIQGRVRGKSLQQLFFFPKEKYKVDKTALQEFLCAHDNTVWANFSKETHVPFVLLFRHIFLPIAQKLCSLERQGLQHGDISPANIMWSEDFADFRLVDLALISKIGTPLLGSGTAPYAPPESPDGLVHIGTDIRALSAICWRLLGNSLSRDQGQRKRDFRYAPNPDAYSDSFIRRIATSVDPRYKIISDATVARLGRLIQESEKNWRDYLCGIYLAEEEYSEINASDVYDTISKSLNKLDERIREELQGTAFRKQQFTERVSLLAALTLTFSISLICKIFLPTVGNIIVWAATSPIFLIISYVIAVSPVVLGVTVDSVVAWKHFKRINPKERFSIVKFQLVAKYGSLDSIVKGAGRFDPTVESCAYYGLCNITSMLSYESLLIACVSLKGFARYIIKQNFISVLGIFAPVIATIIAWHAIIYEQRMPPMITQRKDRENPDNNSFSRVHVWANIVHLTWTLTWVIILLYGLLTFCTTYFRVLPSSLILIWPVIQLTIFTLFSSISPHAQRIEAEAAGLLEPLLLTSATLALLFAYVFFRPSPASPIFLLIAGFDIFVSLWIHKRLKAGKKFGSHVRSKYNRYETIIWLDRARRNVWLLLVIVLSIISLTIACIIIRMFSSL